MKNITHIVPVLDASGSMDRSTSFVMDALRVFVEEQRKLSMLTKLTVLGFGDHAHTMYRMPEDEYLHRVKPGDLPYTYNCPGGTAIPTSLLQILKGDSGNHWVDEHFSARAKVLCQRIREGGPAVVMMFTDGAGLDGLESQSTLAMAEMRKRGWLFLFCEMTGGQQAVAQERGKRYGFHREHCISVPLSPAGLKTAMLDFSARVIDFRNEAALKVAA